MFWHSLLVLGVDLVFHDMINLDRGRARKSTSTLAWGQADTKQPDLFFASVKDGVDLHAFDQLLLYVRAFDSGYFLENDIRLTVSPILDHLFYAWASVAINILSPENPKLLKSLLHAANIFEPFCPKSVVLFMSGPPQNKEMLQQNISKCNKPPHKVAFLNKLVCPSCSFHRIKAHSTAVYLKYKNTIFSKITFVYASVKQTRRTFSFSLSNTNTHILIPSTSFPKCTQCFENISNTILNFLSSRTQYPQIHMCEEVHILLHPSTSITKQNISIINISHKEYHRTPFHVFLIPQCEIQVKLSCFTTLMSWNDVFDHCKQQNLHLPSVHSKADIDYIFDQLERFQAEISQYQLKTYKCKSTLSDEDEIFHSNTQVMYQTIGLFLGLHSQVLQMNVLLKLLFCSTNCQIVVGSESNGLC